MQPCATNADRYTHELATVRRLDIRLQRCDPASDRTLVDVFLGSPLATQEPPTVYSVVLSKPPQANFALLGTGMYRGASLT